MRGPVITDNADGLQLTGVSKRTSPRRLPPPAPRLCGPHLSADPPLNARTLRHVTPAARSQCGLSGDAPLPGGRLLRTCFNGQLRNLPRIQAENAPPSPSAQTAGAAARAVWSHYCPPGCGRSAGGARLTPRRRPRPRSLRAREGHRGRQCQDSGSLSGAPPKRRR